MTFSFRLSRFAFFGFLYCWLITFDIWYFDFCLLPLGFLIFSLLTFHFHPFWPLRVSGIWIQLIYHLISWHFTFSFCAFDLYTYHFTCVFDFWHFDSLSFWPVILTFSSKLFKVWRLPVLTFSHLTFFFNFIFSFVFFHFDFLAWDPNLLCIPSPSSFSRYEKGLLTCRCKPPTRYVICVVPWSLNIHQI